MRSVFRCRIRKLTEKRRYCRPVAPNKISWGLCTLALPVKKRLVLGNGKSLILSNEVSGWGTSQNRAVLATEKYVSFPECTASET